MIVAYEHIRLAPQGELAQELQARILEDLLEEDCLDATDDNDVDETSSAAAANGNGVETRGSFFCSRVFENPELDIGFSDNKAPPHDVCLESDEQNVLRKVYEATSGAQVSRAKMDCAPQWVLGRSINEELTKSWEGAFEEVLESDVYQSTNVISSHIVCKVKCKEKTR